ncbi:MAG TPA: DUF5658 family protein [Candidatus Dormibacteraeota bacterium]
MGMRSTGEAALARDGRWLRQLFRYRDTWILVGAFLAMQVLDSVTTAFALSTGRFSEANPLFDHLMAAAPAAGYVFKLAIAVLVVALLLLLRLRWRMRRVVLTVFIVTSMVAPVANVLRVTGHL